jgi:hypothetical protein
LNRMAILCGVRSRRDPIGEHEDLSAGICERCSKRSDPVSEQIDPPHL